MVDGYEEEAAERFSDETERPEAGQGLPDGAVRAELFGARAPLAEKFAERLLTDGIQRGLIGPREGDRLWERHLYNSAVLSELLPEGATVVDVGSGAGLPGVPLAIARPDLRITLLEPMARRITWLEEIRDDLDLHVTVLRGRAEESEVRSRLHDVDCVVARAVGSLERLTAWCLPLVRPGGWLLAQKGASAEQELDRDRAAITRQGGERAVVRICGESVLPSPARVVAIRRTESVDQGGASGVRGRGRGSARRPHKRRKRKER